MHDQVSTDEELAALVQRGDVERFGMLMVRYEPKLMRYGSRFLAQTDDIREIVQDVFIKTYQDIQSFDTTQRFSPWIYRIAHNTFANELRRKSRNPIRLPDFDILLSHSAAIESSDSESERASLARMVERGLNSISPKYREVLVLYFMEELSYKEIADVLRVPVNTVGVRLARAKSALKASYTERNISYEQ
ncbi:MAG: RNA polymerase sigma-70 factor, ECF subfamily [Parcubacteria bacterium C7867-008]|nr:MAG: RNA polymerase sigma-70 factor, ECF subfamily [Parcubacteria bacterium C7867-008]